MIYPCYPVSFQRNGAELMAETLKIRKIGNSLGVTLSDQVKKMGLKEGDQLYVVQTRNGIELTPFDPDFAEAMEDAKEFMRHYPNAMKELAK